MDEHEEFDHLSDALNSAMYVLNSWERRIFEARRLADEEITLEDLSAEFGVSRERERQIAWSAFEKVQSTVKQGSQSREAVWQHLKQWSNFTRTARGFPC
jgi:RNA polymerase sigma-32 factor